MSFSRGDSSRSRNNSNPNSHHAPSVIYHEKQDARLCGVHCLNNLVQGAYFSEVDLMTIAQRLDGEERKVMAQQGVTSPEYLQYMAEDSGNVSDEGDFSVQVMSEALSNLNLTCEILSSERERDNVSFDQESAFICNYFQHWFTIRKLNNMWWNLDSLKDEPEYISNTYMTLLLAQLRAENYSIFVVRGTLPRCRADEHPELVVKPTTAFAERLLPPHPGHQLGYGGERPVGPDEPRRGYVVTNDDSELAKAIAMSMGGKGEDADEDPELQMALAMSMQQDPGSSSSGGKVAAGVFSEGAIPKGPPAPPVGVNIPSEPPKTEGNTALIVMQLPNGNRTERLFRGSDLLEGVLAYAAQAANMPVGSVELVTAFPHSVHADPRKCVEESGFIPRILVHVEPKRDRA